jgi:FAD-dependent urate hydroxylase
MKVLVIGGGVCRPVTAMALQRAGIDAIVYEAHDAQTNDRGSYLKAPLHRGSAWRDGADDRPCRDGGIQRLPGLCHGSGAGRSFCRIAFG